ncbi:MAG: hypothetical protein L3V56_05145 [Candidatus Magnetoovum sp. WYHC-5]|nr:hypothetical protein [Candidatus Magnetoovum sp. WYHC-5]
MKIAAISIEKEDVKIIYAVKKGKSFNVIQSQKINGNELDNYLQKDKTKRYIIIYDFDEILQDIVNIPPAEDKYNHALIANEIRKQYPDIKEFSFVEFFIDNKIEGNKRYKEFAVFTIKHTEINKIINRFNEYGKIILSIYPASLLPLSLLPDIHEPYLCAFDIVNNKNTILVRHKSIFFSRQSQVLGISTATTDFDIQNLNMTINYCRQNLRINPQFILLFGAMSRDFYVQNFPLIPIASYNFSSFLKIDKELFDNNFFPITAIHYFLKRKYAPTKDKTRLHLNFLTKEYNHIIAFYNYFKYSSIAFIIISIILSLFIIKNLTSISEHKTSITLVRSQSAALQNVVTAITERMGAFDQKKKLLEFIKTHNTTPHVSDFLITLSDMETLLNGLIIDNISWETIKVDNDDETIAATTSSKIKITGSAKLLSLPVAQTAVETLEKTITAIQTVKDILTNFNLSSKAFSIEFIITNINPTENQTQ